jgi:hypothetical protein
MMGGRPALRVSHGLIAVLVLVGAAVAALAGGWGGADRAGGPSQHEARGPQDRGWGPSVGFANRDRLEDHYRKHGGEFGSVTRQEYLRQAQALRDAPAGGPVLEAVRRDGVITRFDRRSGAFLAFNPDGVIRTFFRPNDGERYFHRQLDRGR